MFFGVNGRKLHRQYKDFNSDFKTWTQRNHSKEFILFPTNIGKQLSIDVTALSHGEHYTILMNKEAKGKKGSIVAIITGKSSGIVRSHLDKIPFR